MRDPAALADALGRVMVAHNLTELEIPGVRLLRQATAHAPPKGDGGPKRRTFDEAIEADDDFTHYEAHGVVPPTRGRG